MEGQFFDVKVVYLFQIERHKQQVVKTLTLGSCPLNSLGSNKQVSIKGGYHSHVSLAVYPSKEYNLREFLTLFSSRIRIEEVNKKYYAHVMNMCFNRCLIQDYP